MEAIQGEGRGEQLDKRAATDLTTGPVARTLVAFSLPFMVGTLLQTLYPTVDTAVVGQYLGSAGLSAVSGGSQIMQVVYMLCIGFINAGQVLIAQFVGARRDERSATSPPFSRRGSPSAAPAWTARTSTPESTTACARRRGAGSPSAPVISVAFGALFVVAPEACFRVFTQDPEVLALAPMAMFTLAVSMPTRCVMSACEALIEAQGFASFLLVISLVDAFAGRVFFCWLFGTVLGMGAFGMFLGYNLATYLTAIPVFVYYVSGMWLRREGRKALAA